MQNRPMAAELLDAVRELLSTEVLPTIQDDGLRFKVLIAANVLAIVGRELTIGEPLRQAEFDRLAKLLPEILRDGVDITTLNLQLVAAIRAIPAEKAAIAPGGDIWVHVKQTLHDQLVIANPKFSL